MFIERVEHDHCHGCCHEHSHHDQEMFYQEDGISPVVYSVMKSVNQPESINGKILLEKYRDVVNGVAKWTENACGIVGHIKLFIETPDGTKKLWISRAGGSLSERYTDGWETAVICAYTLGFSAILINVDAEDLSKIIADMSL